MDKKKLPTIKEKAQEVVESMQTDSTAPGNPTGIRCLAEILVELIEILEKP